ncbi:MAG TPA: hypothetical protein DCE44_26075, partial [Verrucomicrobiales bacterium]|nr:hypothetical protein [Verrucomicrobiales bacterium]
MSNVAVVHCCTHLRVLGGVQSVLRRHLRRDREVGIDSSAVIFFENEPFTEAPPDTPVSGLGLRWYHSGRTLRKRFERVRPSRIAAGESWVHHDLWCLPTLADLDTETGGRRIGLLHSHWVGADQLLRACDGLLDGILCVSAATVTLARNCLPSLSPERVSWIPYPVDIPEGIPPRGEVSRKELVLGYCGRVQRPQKRVERLPAIARELRA